MCNINRDDASGYRLDTLTTHHQYSSPVVQGKEILTTHTDYVTPYPSVLQTISYNFSSTENTSETCAGVVKAHSLFPKNAAQHAADLEMLQHKPELATVFINPETRTIKAVECIQVDGASDEGPSHHETQFYWTERHLKEAKLATLVTTRSSGSSYLNRVELQNGCLSRAHSNLFIPSTLNGSRLMKIFCTETWNLLLKFTFNDAMSVLVDQPLFTYTKVLCLTRKDEKILTYFSKDQSLKKCSYKGRIHLDTVNLRRYGRLETGMQLLDYQASTFFICVAVTSLNAHVLFVN